MTSRARWPSYTINAQSHLMGLYLEEALNWAAKWKPAENFYCLIVFKLLYCSDLQHCVCLNSIIFFFHFHNWALCNYLGVEFPVGMKRISCIPLKCLHRNKHAECWAFVALCTYQTDHNVTTRWLSVPKSNLPLGCGGQQRSSWKWRLSVRRFWLSRCWSSSPRVGRNVSVPYRRNPS